MVSPGPLGPPRSPKEDTANSGKHLWISDMAGGRAYLSSGDRRAAPVTATLWIATTEGKLPDPSGRAQGPRPTQANTAKPCRARPSPLCLQWGHLPFSEDGRGHMSRKAALVQHRSPHPATPACGPPRCLSGSLGLLLCCSGPGTRPRDPALQHGCICTPSRLLGQPPRWTPNRLVSNPTPRAHHTPHRRDEG